MTRITSQQIIRAVAEDAKLPYEAILSQARYRRVARPRQVAMWLMRRLCPHLSYPDIGRRLGGRDHTTALHGVRKIDELLQFDPELALQVVRIEASVLETARASELVKTINTPTHVPFATLCNGYAAVMRQAA